MDKFRIKTDIGYYYTTGKGRYGCATGTRIQADVFCSGCVDCVLTTFKEVAPELNARKKIFNGHAQCQVCKT